MENNWWEDVIKNCPKAFKEFNRWHPGRKYEFYYHPEIDSIGFNTKDHCFVKINNRDLYDFFDSKEINLFIEQESYFDIKKEWEFQGKIYDKKTDLFDFTFLDTDRIKAETTMYIKAFELLEERLE